MPHPLIKLQKANQQQILDYKCALVAEAVLQHDPIDPTESFIRDIIEAALSENVQPPLAKMWQEFQTL